MHYIWERVKGGDMEVKFQYIEEMETELLTKILLEPRLARLRNISCL